MYNPYALYINCDGAMDYDSRSSGGIGYVITFPDNIDMEQILISKGTYVGGNPETMEMEALIQGIKETISLFQQHSAILKSISQIIFISDRYNLQDSERTSPFRIARLRRNKWKTYEGKPIKNHKLLDELDKERQKLGHVSKARINIEFRPRKKNKIADKLSKKGKANNLINQKLWKKGEKIGRRRFDGPEVNYRNFKSGVKIHISVFRKDPVQDEWEVWGEICNGPEHSKKVKIYAENELASNLSRGNEYIVTIFAKYSNFLRIYGSINEVKRMTLKEFKNKYYLKRDYKRSDENNYSCDLHICSKHDNKVVMTNSSTIKIDPCAEIDQDLSSYPISTTSLLNETLVTLFNLTLLRFGITETVKGNSKKEIATFFKGVSFKLD